jgi:hypothetical protein
MLFGAEIPNPNFQIPSKSQRRHRRDLIEAWGNAPGTSIEVISER